ncbi:MobQ family relaxase [Pseudomonas veronii]
MAIYHLSVKAVSRSAGRSATAAAAYRAGCEIADERTGEIHDYTRKGGVESADIVLPDGAPEWATDRAKLWNAAELAEKRKDACVAREFEVALPSELSPAERRRLALDFAKDMANREGCAVDVAIHAPGREGDNRNHHAHILRTTRKVEADGLGAKLDTEKAGRKRSDDLEAVRAKWADLTNERLRENGIAARVDHRSLEAQGIDREPTQHLGPAASGYERRTGQPSDKRIQQEREAVERLARAKALGELERQSRQSDRLILDLSGDLSAAKAERDRQPAPEVKQAAASGVADFRAQFEAAKLAEAGKQQARQAFEQFKAEQERQRQAELARQQAAERVAQELAKQREDAERKQQAERAPKPKIDRGGPSLG